MNSTVKKLVILKERKGVGRQSMCGVCAHAYTHNVHASVHTHRHTEGRGTENKTER